MMQPEFISQDFDYWALFESKTTCRIYIPSNSPKYISSTTRDQSSYWDTSFWRYRTESSFEIRGLVWWIETSFEKSTEVFLTFPWISTEKIWLFREFVISTVIGYDIHSCTLSPRCPNPGEIDWRAFQQIVDNIFHGSLRSTDME